jgi:hypothetical protein
LAFQDAFEMLKYDGMFRHKLFKDSDQESTALKQLLTACIVAVDELTSLLHEARFGKPKPVKPVVEKSPLASPVRNENIVKSSTSPKKPEVKLVAASVDEKKPSSILHRAVLPENNKTEIVNDVKAPKTSLLQKLPILRLFFEPTMEKVESTITNDLQIRLWAFDSKFLTLFIR